jgi:hypothetical protein
MDNEKRGLNVNAPAFVPNVNAPVFVPGQRFVAPNIHQPPPPMPVQQRTFVFCLFICFCFSRYGDTLTGASGSMPTYRSATTNCVSR